MSRSEFRIRLAAIAGLCFFLSIASTAQELPTHLSDEAFWKLVMEFSEPSGRFPQDNFVSNELSTQHVLSTLIPDRMAAGAYIGVGPEQNFTYIVALKPKIAFIIDIRRQNMIEHLMYKALVELSANRVEFLSRLFCRPRPTELPSDANAAALFNAFRGIDPDPKLFDENLRAMKIHLTNIHGFALTSDDENTLAYVFRAFYLGGTNIGYGATRPGTIRILPNYEELMLDTDEQGQRRSYLATEENFATLRQIELNNLIVPLVGDFAGPSAIRSIGRYLKDRNTNVSAFYTSNVEQYLFMSRDEWKKFYANVATLPLDGKSVFIRPLINTGLDGYSSSPLFRQGFHWDTLLFPIRDLITAFNSGMIESYYDVIATRN